MNSLNKSILAGALLLGMFIISFLIASQNDYVNFCSDDTCIMSLIIDSDDYDLCQFSNNSDFCYSRLSRIYNESSFCKNTLNQSLCVYEYALHSRDYSYCLGLDNLSDNCIFDIAVRLEDSSLCKIAEDINYCFYSYAVWAKDEKLCNESENYKNACLNNILGD